MAQLEGTPRGHRRRRGVFSFVEQVEDLQKNRAVKSCRVVSRVFFVFIFRKVPHAAILPIKVGGDREDVALSYVYANSRVCGSQLAVCVSCEPVCVCVSLVRVVIICLASTHTALVSSPSLGVLHLPIPNAPN